VGGAAGQVDPARAQLDEEEDVQGLEAERLDGEEVAGQQLVLVAVDEIAPGRHPPPLRGGRHAVPPEGRPHGRGADRLAELGQLALDAAMPPAGILPRQAENERLDPGRDARATAQIRPPVGPLAPDQRAVPPEHRVGLEQEHTAL
jgi:hypothetical protein